MKTLIDALLKQGVEVTLGSTREHCHFTGKEVDMAEVELCHVESGTIIGFCRRTDLEEALTHLVARCVGDVARTKAAMQECDFLNNTDIEEL